MTVDRKQQAINDLQQCWVHSHEEDTETETVYRPTSFDFPPARGRTGFELHADQSCIRIGIAAADGSVVSDGTWEVEDSDGLQIRIKCQNESQTLDVVSMDRDRLVIRRTSNS